MRKIEIAASQNDARLGQKGELDSSDSREIEEKNVSSPSIPRYIKKEKKIEAGEKMNFQEQNNIPCINTKPTL